MTVEEYRAAENCRADSVIRPRRSSLKATSIAEVKQNLALILGRTMSNTEVDRALSDLALSEDEKRPDALNKLRDRMEANLSSMVGQTIARRIVDGYLPYQSVDSSLTTENIHSIESRIETDLTPLTGVAAELDNLRRYHRQTLQKLPVPVCSIDSHQYILSWNSAMEELTHISSNLVIGRKLDSIAAPWMTALVEFAQTNEMRSLEQQIGNGPSTRVVNFHKAAIEERDSRDQNLVIVIEDITEIHLLQDKLVHNERLASIGQFAAGVAHEIGNPVTGIACLAQNIKLETLNEEMRDMSDQILDQTGRISTILQSLVYFAHTGRGISDYHEDPFDVSQCLVQAIHLLSLSQENRGITLANNCEAGMIVLGDEHRLSQVFLNLLTNASDASERNGEVSIESASTADEIFIEIKDQGHGISSEDIKHIQEPFFTTKDPGKGTGLGLAIAYTIIREHNGEIKIQSPISPGVKGTAVTIRLPRYIDPELQSRPGSTAEPGNTDGNIT
jgi:PAS domain S-box-containing protein